MADSLGKFALRLTSTRFASRMVLTRPQARIAVLMLLFGVHAALSITGAEPLVAPNGPPPHQARVILQGEWLLLETVMFEPVQETRERELEIGGKLEKQTYTVTRMAGKYFVRPIPNESVLVFTVAGKRLSQEEAAAALAKETEVLVSPVGKLLDPTYRMLFDPAALIVYVKPEAMFGYASGPSPGSRNPVPPVPEFSKKDPPQGMGVGAGLLRKRGDHLVLLQFDWDVVNEYKAVVVEEAGSAGGTRTTTKTVTQINWVPTPRERSFQRGELTTWNREGKQTHGAFDVLTEVPFPVLLHNSLDKFDPKRFTLASPNAIVVRAEFPPPDFAAKYSAPLAPVECLARIKDGKLNVGRTVSMSAVVKVPRIKEEGGKSANKLVDEVKTYSKSVWQDYSLSDVRASEAAGKSVDAATLAQRLSEETAVLLAEGYDRVDPTYLDRVKPDAIVLSLPATQRGPSPIVVAPNPPATGNAAPPIAPTPAVAPQDPNGPDLQQASGPAPRFVRIQAFGNKLVLSEPVTAMGYAPPPREPPAGQAAAGATKVVAHWNSCVIRGEDFRLFDVDGRPMDAAAFASLANRPVIALLSTQRKRVDSVWLTIFKPGTLIVYVKPEAMPGGAMQGEMPSIRPPE